MIFSSSIILRCNPDDLAFIAVFPEGHTGISQDQRDDKTGFMLGCKKLYRFPDMKEVLLS